MAASTDKRIKAAWANECSKEHTSTKKIAEEVMVDIKVDVEFGMGNISIGNETVDKKAEPKEYAKRNSQKPHKR